MTKNDPLLLMENDSLEEKFERKGGYFYFNFRKKKFI